MAYYHVLLSFDDDPKTVRCLFTDLSDKDLRKRFISPYRRGKNLLCGSEVVAVSRIRTLKIIRTADVSAAELKTIREEGLKEFHRLNQSSKLRVLRAFERGDRLEDIGEAGEEVTTEFIHGPPGHGDRWTIVAAVLNHPLISGIAAGVIVAALIWWFGWN